VRQVSIVGLHQITVRKENNSGLREMAREVAVGAMANAGVDHIDALYVSNMLSDELQGQKHLGALFADHSGVAGVEALQIRAATASGAAALRVGYLAVASGDVDSALIIGVEKMSGGVATPMIAKALDGRKEVPDGATLISQNARLMKLYSRTYKPPSDAIAHFPVLAHKNAAHNPFALFRDVQFSTEDVLTSRIISPPIRLFDCSPICDGAAAVLLAPSDRANDYTGSPVRILASSVATDRFRFADRPDPLMIRGARLSAEKAFNKSGISRDDISFFEVHDAFSIMACLALEAAGFAQPGEAWRMAIEGDLNIGGRLPITTMGGLKARGHPIGASAIYQTCETIQQLRGEAGPNQVNNPEIGLMQSVGGVASTVITHILGIS
jgi:acetyl-CoA C-acetyltransferase